MNTLQRVRAWWRPERPERPPTDESRATNVQCWRGVSAVGHVLVGETAWLLLLALPLAYLLGVGWLWPVLRWVIVWRGARIGSRLVRVLLWRAARFVASRLARVMVGVAQRVLARQPVTENGDDNTSRNVPLLDVPARGTDMNASAAPLPLPLQN